MKRALVTMMDDAFMMGYEAFMTSFLINNPWFSDDMVIIDLGLSDESKSVIESYYSKIIYVIPKYENYQRVNFAKTADSLKNTYYKLDAFSFYGYDKVVFIDMDTIVLGDVSEVFEACGFSAVLGYDAENDCMRGDINSGVFVIGKEYLNEETYTRLISIAEQGFSMPDQKTINIYFRGKINFLGKKYNVEKRMLATSKYKEVLCDARIVHFVALKPWQDHSSVPAREKQYGTLEDLWHQWYSRREEVRGKN